MSLFLTVMKGDFDPILQWPFRHKVTMSLIDQESNHNHLTHWFMPDVLNHPVSFNRPVHEMNIACGETFCFIPVTHIS